MMGAGLRGLVAALAVAAVGVAVFLTMSVEPERRDGAPDAPTGTGAARTEVAQGAPEGTGQQRSSAASPHDFDPSAAPPRTSGAATHGSPGGSGPTPIYWPIAARPRAGGAGAAVAAAATEPSVPVSVAFRALWYLGVDPEAERTWVRAINDRNMPPGVRSDLIADMVDEGYTDNNRPTKADLPTILARLEILERYAPHAMDEVNRAAFEQAYRGLLEIYLRLVGTR